MATKMAAQRAVVRIMESEKKSLGHQSTHNFVSSRGQPLVRQLMLSAHPACCAGWSARLIEPSQMIRARLPCS
jgi:hypothetical protein